MAVARQFPVHRPQSFSHARAYTALEAACHLYRHGFRFRSCPETLPKAGRHPHLRRGVPNLQPPTAESSLPPTSHHVLSSTVAALTAWKIREGSTLKVHSWIASKVHE